MRCHVKPRKSSSTTHLERGNPLQLKDPRVVSPLSTPVALPRPVQCKNYAPQAFRVLCYDRRSGGLCGANLSQRGMTPICVFFRQRSLANSFLSIYFGRCMSYKGTTSRGPCVIFFVGPPLHRGRDSRAPEARNKGTKAPQHRSTIARGRTESTHGGGQNKANVGPKETAASRETEAEACPPARATRPRRKRYA